MADLRNKDLGHHFPLFREGVVGEDWKKLTNIAVVDDGGTAGTADEALALYAPHRMMITDIYLIPVDGDITGQNTNYTSVEVLNRGTDGTGTDSITSVDFDSGEDAGQYEAKELTVDADYDEVEQGEIVTVDLTKTGTGLAVNAVAVVVVCKAIE